MDRNFPQNYGHRITEGSSTHKKHKISSIPESTAKRQPSHRNAFKASPPDLTFTAQCGRGLCLVAIPEEAQGSDQPVQEAHHVLWRAQHSQVLGQE